MISAEGLDLVERVALLLTNVEKRVETSVEGNSYHLSSHIGCWVLKIRAQEYVSRTHSPVTHRE